MAHILPHLITKNWSFGGDDGALHHHFPSLFRSMMTEASSQFSIRSIFSIFIVSFLTIISYHFNNSKRKKNYKIPPYAPGSILHHIRMTTNSQYPWWIINVASQLNTSIFQFKIPIAPLSHKFAIGEVHTFRQILQDPLSERPLFIFKAVRRVYGANKGGVGTPTVLTTNGSVWHSKRKAIATAFSSNHVKRMNKVAVEMTDCWIHERLQTTSNSNKNNAISEPFDVAEEIVNVVLSAICETGFEYKISSEEKEQLGIDLQSALTEFVTRESLNKWRAYTGMLLPERRRAIRASQRFNALMLKIMEQYRMLDKPTPGTIINAVMESDAFRLPNR